MARGHTILDVDVEGCIPEPVVALDGKRWVHIVMTYEGQPAWPVRLHDHGWLAADGGRLIRQAPRSEWEARAPPSPGE